MEKNKGILSIVFMIFTIAVCTVAAIAVYKAKFKKNYITVCD